MADKHERDISKLTTSEAEELLRHVRDVSRTFLPLGPGLRAAAAEAPTQRLVRVLGSLADAVDRGQSLEEILSSSRSHLASHVGGLVAAAARTDRVGEVLSDLVEHHRRVRQLWRVVLASLAYPAIVLSIAFALIVASSLLIIPQFEKLFREFELMLPAPTQLLIDWYRTWMRMLAGTLSVVTIAFILLRVIGGRAVWKRAFSTVPLVGPMSHWSGVAEWSRLLGLLVEHDVPLAEALRLAGDGSSDANLRQISRELSARSAHGPTLSRLVGSSFRLPRLLVPLIHWGETTGRLSEALRMASDLFVERVRLRSMMFRAALPPLVFIFVAVTLGYMIAALTLPMIALIKYLSG